MDPGTERRDRHPALATAVLLALLAAHARTPLGDLLDTVPATVAAPRHEDDIALNTVRTGGAGMKPAGAG